MDCCILIPQHIDDFEARSPDELSLQKGERIELIERDDDFGDGWYLGKHITNGKIGLFPEGEFVATNLTHRICDPLKTNLKSLHDDYTSGHWQPCGHRGLPRSCKYSY